MKTAQIALVAHAALAMLDEFNGDTDVVHDFELLPEGRQAGLVAGVELLVTDLDATAEARHLAWMEQMTANEWVYGKKLDEENKLHPRLVAFSDLPKSEQEKEVMFHAIVRALSKIEVPAEAAPLVVQTTITGMTPIQYIGGRDEHHDNLYGSGLEWKNGQTRNVPSAIALKMLAHDDTYKQNGTAVSEATTVADKDKPEKLPVPLPNLDGMNKQELMTFAQQHYGEHLHHKMNEGNMRDRIMALVQARGR